MKPKVAKVDEATKGEKIINLRNMLRKRKLSMRLNPHRARVAASVSMTIRRFME